MPALCCTLPLITVSHLNLSVKSLILRIAVNILYESSVKSLILRTKYRSARYMFCTWAKNEQYGTLAQEIVDRYADLPGDQLLPFESSERYNDNIKIIFEKAGQGPEPRLSPHRSRRRQPRLHPLPHDRHRHEEGSCEDFEGKAVIDWWLTLSWFKLIWKVVPKLLKNANFGTTFC